MSREDEIKAMSDERLKEIRRCPTPGDVGMGGV